MRLLQIPKKSNKPSGSQVKTGRPSKNMCKPCKGWGSLWTVLTKIYYYYYGDGSEQAREEQDVLVKNVWSQRYRLQRWQAAVLSTTRHG
jgi:hypothetical protein